MRVMNVYIGSFGSDGRVYWEKRLSGASMLQIKALFQPEFKLETKVLEKGLTFIPSVNRIKLSIFNKQVNAINRRI